MSWPLAPALLLALSFVGCGGATPPTPHGQLTNLSRTASSAELCEHRVPAAVCSRHHPELTEHFKRAGDWCGPHDVPESQCLICHPDLTFEPLPELPPGADVAWLTETGEDIFPLSAHAAVGKVTVFEFYADWCAACRKVDAYLLRRIADGDPKLAYRKLDIQSWDSPLAKRYLATTPELPLIIVVAPDGRTSKSITGADLNALEAALAEALQ